MIRTGQKTIELRLLDEKRRAVGVGDVIVFVNTDTSEMLEAVVKVLYHFDTFEELYGSLPLLKCGYTPENVGGASFRDMEQYYSAEEQSKYGVVGIEIRRL